MAEALGQRDGSQLLLNQRACAGLMTDPKHESQFTLDSPQLAPQSEARHQHAQEKPAGQPDGDNRGKVSMDPVMLATAIRELGLPKVAKQSTLRVRSGAKTRSELLPRFHTHPEEIIASTTQGHVSHFKSDDRTRNGITAASSNPHQSDQREGEVFASGARPPAGCVNDSDDRQREVATRSEPFAH